MKILINQRACLIFLFCKRKLSRTGQPQFLFHTPYASRWTVIGIFYSSQVHEKSQTIMLACTQQYHYMVLLELFKFSAFNRVRQSTPILNQLQHHTANPMIRFFNSSVNLRTYKPFLSLSELFSSARSLSSLLVSSQSEVRSWNIGSVLDRSQFEIFYMLLPKERKTFLNRIRNELNNSLHGIQPGFS